jgi:hypothetical protein
MAARASAGRESIAAVGVGKTPTVQPAGVVDSPPSRGGQNNSQRESFAHPVPAPVLSTPERPAKGGQNAAPKKRGRPSADKRGGWIEFPVKSGKRYPRRRQWKKKDGQWRKVSLGKAEELELMSEQEYQTYAELRERARAARRKHRNG